MAKKQKEQFKKQLKTPVLTDSVMEKIQNQEVKMTPKAYFWLGSVLLGIGAVGVFGLTVFFASIWIFQMRAQRLFGPEALELIRRPMFLPQFPWIPLAVTVSSFVVGLTLIKKYDFAYKKNWWVIVLGMLLGVTLMTGLVDGSGLNDRLSKDKRTERFYRHCMDDDGGCSGRPRVKGRMRLR